MENAQMMKANLNDFAIRSFRDVADQDYINARLCYRNGLMHQYSWAALQTIEKLLKGILLFNEVHSKKLGHKLIKSYDRIRSEIPDLNFVLTDDCYQYLKHLDNIGENRYLTKAHFNLPNELVFLDKSVWMIRRYCQDLRVVISKDGKEVDTFEAKLRAVQNLEASRCCSNVTHRGLLEKIVSDPNDMRHDALVWQNYFFNSKKLESVTIPYNFNAINPTHLLHLEMFDRLAELVHFSSAEDREFREYIQSQTKK